jgi:hypothetical protein
MRYSKTYNWLVAHMGVRQTDCLLWPYSVDVEGYPKGRRHGAVFLGNRLMCELAHGPPPSPKHLAVHSCDVPTCVNPAHLRWATQKENMNDKVVRGRSLRGERHWAVKLTTAIAIECKRRLLAGEGCATIARDVGVDPSAIRLMKKGRNWGWLHVSP